MTVIPRGVLSAGVVGQQNYSVQFFLDRPGHLSGSWMSDVMGPPSTAYLFSSADCRVVSSTLNDVECAGSPLWRGRPDVTTYDSLNYTAGAGTYRCSLGRARFHLKPVYHRLDADRPGPYALVVALTPISAHERPSAYTEPWLALPRPSASSFRTDTF